MKRALKSQILKGKKKSTLYVKTDSNQTNYRGRLSKNTVLYLTQWDDGAVWCGRDKTEKWIFTSLKRNSSHLKGLGFFYVVRKFK